MIDVGSRITTEDVANLQKLWIDQTAAVAAHMRRVDNAEAAEITGKTNAAGLYIANFAPNSSAAAEPRSWAIHTDAGKRIAPHRDIIYFPGTTAAYLQDPTVPVVLTSDELRAIALHRLATWNLPAATPQTGITNAELAEFIDAMQCWHPGMTHDSIASLYRQAWEEAGAPPMSTFRFLEQFSARDIKKPTSFYPKVLQEQLQGWMRENARMVETHQYEREQKQLRMPTQQPRFVTASFGNAWQWRKDGAPIADLDLFQWRGRRVAIAFDADETEAASKLTAELHRRSALVGLLKWEPRIYQGAPAIHALLAQAGPEVVLKLWENTKYHARKAEERSPFRVDKDQVLYVDPDGEKGPVRICGRLEVLAKSRDQDSEAWGRLLSWRDDDQVEHRWLCPAELLAGDGSEIRARLAAGGLHLSPGSRGKQLLLSYLVNAQTDTRITCTPAIGWHDQTFVLPKRSIGPKAHEVLLQSLNTEAHLRTAGKLEQWQQHVAKPAQGNSRLQLAIAAALAGPTLFLSGLESGGIHFCGTTSKGKTTALMVGGSALGGGGKAGFLHSWHNTMNGLEAIAESHNDLTLFLDELGQVDAREAQETAYLLGNGSGKGRMHKSLAQRRKLTWTLLYVSAGETTLADHMASVGKTAKGGAEIRLLNIPADTGRHGLFEELHGAADAATFARRIKEAALRYYGTPLVPWLEYLTTNRESASKRLKAERQAAAETMAVPAGASGELYRAAERMASIGAAGELAIAAGVLPWREGAAMAAARTCYDAWTKLRGSAAATEEQHGIRKLRLFLEREGASRFQSKPNEKVSNRAGFRREGEFLITSEVWKAEICNGTIAPDALAKLCQEHELLNKHDAGRWTSSERIPALGGQKARVYVISDKILDMD